MQTRKRIAQALVVVGNVALFVLGYGHTKGGLPVVSKTVSDAKASPFFAAGLKTLWVLMSWHWVVFGVIALTAAFGKRAPHRVALFLCGLAILVDAAATVARVGWFIGNELLAVAAVAILGATALFPAP